MIRTILFLAGVLVALEAFIFGVIAILVIVLLVIPTIVPSCYLPTTYHITRVNWMMRYPDMAWEDTPEQAIEHLRQCKSDKRSVAMAMLSHRNGTVVSLGMDLVVKEAFEDGDELLMKFHNDKRWNHNLALNDEYSKLLLATWRIKKGIALTSVDREAMKDWSDEFFESFGVAPPVNARAGS